MVRLRTRTMFCLFCLSVHRLQHAHLECCAAKERKHDPWWSPRVRVDALLSGWLIIAVKHEGLMLYDTKLATVAFDIANRCHESRL